MLPIIGSVFLSIICLVSIIKLRRKIQIMEDSFWAMQIYIYEKTGSMMDEEQLKSYRKYWKK